MPHGAAHDLHAEVAAEHLPEPIARVLHARVAGWLQAQPGAAVEPAPDEDPATNTMVFTVPRPEAPRARLRLIEPGTSERVVALETPSQTCSARWLKE